MREFDAYDIVATQALLLENLEQRFRDRSLSETNYHLSIQLVTDMGLADLRRSRESLLESRPDDYEKQREFVIEHYEEALPLLRDLKAFRELSTE